MAVPEICQNIAVLGMWSHRLVSALAVHQKLLCALPTWARDGTRTHYGNRATWYRQFSSRFCWETLDPDIHKDAVFDIYLDCHCSFIKLDWKTRWYFKPNHFYIEKSVRPTLHSYTCTSSCARLPNRHSCQNELNNRLTALLLHPLLCQSLDLVKRNPINKQSIPSWCLFTSNVLDSVLTFPHFWCNFTLSFLLAIFSSLPLTLPSAKITKTHRGRCLPVIQFIQ